MSAVQDTTAQEAEAKGARHKGQSDLSGVESHPARARRHTRCSARMHVCGRRPKHAEGHARERGEGSAERVPDATRGAMRGCTRAGGGPSMPRDMRGREERAARSACPTPHTVQCEDARVWEETQTCRGASEGERRGQREA
jgi:hypothetical protein